jgi:uncharacterized YigZ family protein
MKRCNVHGIVRTRHLCVKLYSHAKTIIAEGCTSSETIKKSKFVCYARSITSVEAANNVMYELKDGKANHHCWAYRIGDIEKCNDDGEPTGSAGFPILSAIKTHNLQNIIVIVLRYFGGVKLGMGGLIRAYGGVARKCLAECPQVQVVERQVLEVRADMTDIDKVYSAITATPSTTILSKEYMTSHLKMKLAVDEKNYDRLKDMLCGSTRGSAEIVLLLPDQCKTE